MAEESRALCGVETGDTQVFVGSLGEDFPHASPQSGAHAGNLLLFFSRSH